MSITRGYYFNNFGFYTILYICDDKGATLILDLPFVIFSLIKLCVPMLSIQMGTHLMYTIV